MCPNCKTTLSVLDLFPILSYIGLRGRCRYCGTKISIRYMLGEVLVGALFLLAFDRYGLGVEGLFYISFWSMLFIVAMIDYDHMIIMDKVIIFFAIIHLIGIIILKDSFLMHISGALVGFAFYAAIYYISKMVYKKEAFGFGDVILLSSIGLVLGVKKTILVGFLSFYVALICILLTKFKNRKISLKTEIPFGPYVCFSAFLVSIYGNEIYGFISRIF